MKKKDMHEHYWFYEHTVYSGRRNSQEEVGVHRYCKCGLHQMAFTKDWKKAPKNYEFGS